MQIWFRQTHNIGCLWVEKLHAYTEIITNRISLITGQNYQYLWVFNNSLCNNKFHRKKYFLIGFLLRKIFYSDIK